MRIAADTVLSTPMPITHMALKAEQGTDPRFIFATVGLKAEQMTLNLIACKPPAANTMIDVRADGDALVTF